MPDPDLPFFKMNGIGNSILVVDTRPAGRPLSSMAARSIAASDHLAFDQLMAIQSPRSAGTSAYIDIFNGDGSKAEACGNGMRCAARVLMGSSSTGRITVETAGGDLTCERLSSSLFAVDMGRPRLGWREIPLATSAIDTGRVPLPVHEGIPLPFNHFSAVNMGNPHAVFFVGAVSAVPLAEVGPLIEHHPIFPERANVSFAEVVDRSTVRLRVWERSAGATLACGSAACATLVAAVRADLTDRRATVSLPGGDLMIAWRDTDGHVTMTGETELEHQGVLPAHLWAIAA